MFKAHTTNLGFFFPRFISVSSVIDHSQSSIEAWTPPPGSCSIGSKSHGQHHDEAIARINTATKLTIHYRSMEYY